MARIFVILFAAKTKERQSAHLRRLFVMRITLNGCGKRGICLRKTILRVQSDPTQAIDMLWRRRLRFEQIQLFQCLDRMTAIDHLSKLSKRISGG